MFVTKSNEPFSICDGFLKIISDMSSDSKLAQNYEARKTKTAQLTKGKGNQFAVLKKPNVHGLCLKR